MYAPIHFPPAPARVRERTQTNDTLTLTTWLTARERQQVEAANCGCLRFVHREAVTALGPDLAGGRADAAVVAMVSEADDAQVVPATLELGRVGVRVVLDVRKPDGWANFRRTLDPRRQADGFMRTALTTVLGDVGGQQVPCARFFCAAFAPRTRSAKQLAAVLAVHPSTLMSRFYRAGLPSPKTYVTYVRLLWAAHLGESPALSIGDIADRLEASSPQSFSRTVRSVLALTPGQLRRGYDGRAMLERFRHQLIAPYRETLRTFDPLGDTDAQGDRVGQYGREGGRAGRAA